MNRTNSIAWLLLVALTLVAYFFADGWSGGVTPRTVIILSLAAIKFSVVAWWFMELRSVSKVWASALFALLAVILCVFTVLR